MKVRMMFVAVVTVMIAVGMLAIINMHKNPGGEEEMTMNDEKLQLSKECSRLLDASTACLSNLTHEIVQLSDVGARHCG